MSKVISVHEYTLRAGVEVEEFERALNQAINSDLLVLPELQDFHIVKGLRGERQGCYAAIWVYTSREAWERLWGPSHQPRPKAAYPPAWQTWEDQVLAPFLDRDPDRITYTAYQEIAPGERAL